MQKSETIRVPSGTKKKLEDIMEERGYPSISYTAARVVEKSELKPRERVSFWAGVCVGTCIGAVAAAFTVAFLV